MTERGVLREKELIVSGNDEERLKTQMTEIFLISFNQRAIKRRSNTML